MSVLHLLGTGAAYSDGDRTTTMLACEAGEEVVVVDCGGDVVQRLLAHGIRPGRIRALLLTHEHADHVGGFPLFMERIWLAERGRPIDVHGPAPALSQARRAWDTYDTSGWEGLPEIRWREVPLEEGAVVLDDPPWRITAAPGIHSVPVMGVRVDLTGGASVAYSCDTEPSEAITRLARGAGLLLHEAALEETKGHTSIRQAAVVAREAGAGRLVLVHLPPGATDRHLAAARDIFPQVELGADGARYPLPTLH